MGCVQVLAAGPDDWVHPANRKAKLWVNLLDLQAETALTDAALQHIALVCGPRRASTPRAACRPVLVMPGTGCCATCRVLSAQADEAAWLPVAVTPP